MSENVITGNKQANDSESKRGRGQGDALRVALLGNMTTEYLGRAIQETCINNQIRTEIYNSPFGQYNQEILDPGSGLYSFRPELTLLFLEGRELLPHWYAAKTLLLEKDYREKQVRDMAGQLISLMETLHRQSGSKLLFHNFRIPYHSPLGILDNRACPGLKQMLASLNLLLEEYAAGTDYAYIFDYNGFCGTTGQPGPRDHKMYYLAKTPLPLLAFKRLAGEYLRYFLPLRSHNRKCLVLDLDNTLWGGIAGEDGIAGVDLDIAGTGSGFHDFQKEILNLYDKGILIAVNSKNNPEDALEIMENHPHMVLRSRHFACMKINWNDKASNLIEIARELNIGLDSLVFFDDNPVERELVKTSLPQVAIVDVPGDPCKYCDVLRNFAGFESLTFTREDIRRNEMYRLEGERNKMMKKAGSREEYLAGLGTRLKVSEVDDFTLPRVAQLTQKTNQFNMTTRRYQAEQIDGMLKSGGYKVFCCSVSDRFGDSGITGCCIAELEKRKARIDTFLLSCRVLGREVEYAFLSAVIGALRDLGFPVITAEYLQTDKNRANREFYRLAGFAVQEENPERVTFELAEGIPSAEVDCITVKTHT